MARNIEALTFEVTFFKGEEQKPVVFTINVDRDVQDDPKEAAIEHIAVAWDAIKVEPDLVGFLPKFKTFRILGSRRLHDLGMV
jgi:hypothetical protein